MTFGEALEKLKQGVRMTRPGWNGKNMYVLITSVPGIGDVFLLNTAQGDYTFWTIDHTSALATDWQEF